MLYSNETKTKTLFLCLKLLKTLAFLSYATSQFFYTCYSFFFRKNIKQQLLCGNWVMSTFTLICRSGFFIVNFRNQMKLFRSTVAQLIVAFFFVCVCVWVFFFVFFLSDNWILFIPPPRILKNLHLITNKYALSCMFKVS